MRDLTEYERVIEIHKILKKSFLTFDNYSQMFGVGYKTFTRDIEKLKYNLNAPIQKNPKNKSIYYTDKTFDLPTLTLTQKQLTALYSAIPLIENVKDTPIYEMMKKVTQRLQENNKDSMKYTDISLSRLDKKEIKLNWSLFETISKAIKDKNTVLMEYHSFSSNTNTARKADPFHLYVYEDEFYMAAYCHKNKQVRDFNLNRIQSLKLTDEKFYNEKNKKFDLNKYFNEKSWGIIKGGDIQEVKLKIDSSKKDQIIEDFPSRFVEVNLDKADKKSYKNLTSKPKKDTTLDLKNETKKSYKYGINKNKEDKNQKNIKKNKNNQEWQIYIIQTDITNEFINWILSKHGDVVVLEPVELREQIQCICKKIVNSME